MISMNDERFFDLAMKSITRQSTDAESAELASLLASQPELKAEFERLRAEAQLAKEVLPLVAAAESQTGEFPGYARERLQTKVRQTLGSPGAAKEKPGWGWRWLLGLGTAAALLVLLLMPVRQKELIVQVAMLDIAGPTRGSTSHEVAILQQTWKQSPVQSFNSVGELEAWEKSWLAGGKTPVAKVIYDRAAGEIRVLERRDGKSVQKIFPVKGDLAAALNQANAFLLGHGDR